MKTIKNLKAEEIRKSILQLAIQGKLVKQNPNDEPASELVKKIYAEKQKLIKEGKIKKDKNESYIFKGDDNCYYEKIGNSEPVKLEDLPFDIPDNWTYFKLESLTIPVSTKNHQIQSKEVLQEGKWPVISQSQKLIDGFVNNDDKVIIVDSRKPLIMFGDHTRNVKLIDFSFVVGADGTKFFKTILINDQFLYLAIIYFAERLRNRGYARHYSLLKSEFIPLPPINEQKRIVEKFYSFEPLILDYAKAEEKLSTLESEFPEKLKKSILQYAIEGKLVKQNPNDEPASLLLKRIKAEKEKLIKEGKIKRDKNESYIYQGDDKNYYEKVGKNKLIKLEDLPFYIPNNWCWIRFSNLVNFDLGKTPKRNNSEYWSNGKYPWFSIADMKDKQIVFETKEKITEYSLIKNFNSFLVPAGTLIMSFKLTVGRVSILGVNAIHNEAIISIFPYLNEDNSIRNWLFYILGLIVEYIDHTNAIKGKTLNKQKLTSMLIPLPPISEQNKIIDKISNLFVL